MKRRTFLQLTAATALSATMFPSVAAGLSQARERSSARTIDFYFLEILQGFLRNARKTSDSFAVCDFPNGTLLKSCLTPNGKSYVSVARMMPAMAAWVMAKKEPQSFKIGTEIFTVTEVLLAAFRHAFDPAHPDFWGEASKEKVSQRAVEASLVAWALWQLGDDFVGQLSSAERTNIQKWLASCTQIPERENNHAWFSAMNQAARLSLSKRWKEFSGSEEWMLADVTAMEGLAKSAEDGWYSDSPTLTVYDYYNFWTFASHFLYWNRMVGKSYPEISARFSQRLKKFLEKTPSFFAANGSHVLFGRSLIYRWSVLMPLVEGYVQGLWPHSPGLLKAIVRRNLEFHWDAGAFDKENGKLREAFSAGGGTGVREPYIDNGHPYWAMQTFSLYGIPAKDIFWSCREEALPVERSDYKVRLEKAQLLLVGTKSSGQVRMFQARNEARKPRYRDAYQKFSYSSHFPFNYSTAPDRMPWDQALVFRKTQSGRLSGRSGLHGGKMTAEGIETEWWSELGEWRFEVKTRIIIEGEFEKRIHLVTAPVPALNQGIEMVEGSSALGLNAEERYGKTVRPGLQVLQGRGGTLLIASWNIAGFEKIEATERFDAAIPENVNLIYPRQVVNTLRAPVTSERMELVSLHYASPRPLSVKTLLKRVV